MSQQSDVARGSTGGSAQSDSRTVDGDESGERETTRSDIDSLDDATTYAFDAGAMDWQRQYLRDTTREVVASGAYGSGKTRALTEKAVLLSIAYPGNRGLLARKTYASLVNTTLETLLNEVLPSSWIRSHNRSRHLIRVESPLYPSAYCDRCGHTLQRDLAVDDTPPVCPTCEDVRLSRTPLSEIYYDGLNTAKDADIPEKIKSLELGWVGVDEGIEITESDWKALAGRLRLEALDNPWVSDLPFRQIFTATNPDGPNHWMYRRFFEQGIGVVYQSSTADNLANLPDDYLDTLREQYGEASTEAQRYIEGKWAGRDGLVYDEFTEATHVVDPLDVVDVLGDEWTIANADELRANARERRDGSPIGDPTSTDYTPARVKPPSDVDIVLGLDWGYRPDPTVVQFWARTSTHGFVLYRELYRTRTLPDEMARETMDRLTDAECAAIRRAYADHDSGDREDWRQGAEAWVAERIDAGETSATDARDWRKLRTTTAIKDVDSGIKQVKRALRVDANGRAGLHFVRGARAHAPDQHLRTANKPTSTLAELRGYGWKDSESDEPQTTNNHGVDAMRYAIHTSNKRDGGGWDTEVFTS